MIVLSPPLIVQSLTQAQDIACSTPWAGIGGMSFPDGCCKWLESRVGWCNFTQHGLSAIFQQQSGMLLPRIPAWGVSQAWLVWRGGDGGGGGCGGGGNDGTMKGGK